MANFRLKTNCFRLQLFIFLFVALTASSQSSREMKKIFTRANSLYLFGDYMTAKKLFLSIETPDNFNIKYKIGTCYLNIQGEKEKSVPYLESAVKTASNDSKSDSFKEKRAPLDAYFFLAKAYMVTNELEKAISTFQTFSNITKSLKPGMQNFDYIDQEIQSCKNAIQFKENPVAFTKEPLGTGFNRAAINDMPAVSFDGNTLVYTECRDSVNTIMSARKENGSWQPPRDITSELKCGKDCSSCSLNSDGTELFLYKTGNMDGDIYSSAYENGSWSPIKRLNGNINTRFYESHAAISQDGKKLYFTSNREGGSGNLDIYVSEMDISGNWGPAVNLGTEINTPFNEDTPFITSNDSVLYFCSEGHNSMGGYDNFKSIRNNSGWTKPVNLGYPINSTDDDKFYQPLNNELNAFYSMPAEDGKKEIFYLSFAPAEEKAVAPKVYEAINLSKIPSISGVDTTLVVKNMTVSDVNDKNIKDSDVLYYTVQVIALYNPVDVSYFKYVSDIKVMYNDADKFFRYTTGVFATREEAEAHKSELLKKGYPSDIFIKKVSKK